MINESYRIQVNQKSTNINWHNQTCCLQVSPMNTNYDGQKLDAILKWCSKRCKRVVIFINDTLQRHSLAGGYINAASMGDEWFEKNYQLIKESLNQLEQIGFIHWDRWVDDIEFEKTIIGILSLYERDDCFRLAVNTDASQYLIRKKIKQEHVAFRNAVNYLLEELAAYEIQEKNYQAINLHTGRALKSLIYFSKSNNTCSYLRERKFVYLTCRRRSCLQ